jgi:hypothetical protein
MGEDLRTLSCSYCGAPLDETAEALDIYCKACGRGHSSIPPPPRVTDPTSIRDGTEVAVEWGAHWWPATVLEKTGNELFKIHYDGWGEGYDETVGPSRLGMIEDDEIYENIELAPVD